MLRLVRHPNPAHGIQRWVRGGSALALAVVAACLTPVHAGAATAKDEAELRAAILYNLTRFVTWPDSVFRDPGTPVVIGVLGEHAIRQPLERIAAERTTFGDRPLRIVEASDPETASRCHVLFVPDQARDRSEEILASLQRAPVILVGDVLDFVAHEGGSVALILEDQKIRIYLNRAEAAEAGLGIRSQLLRLCKVIEATTAR